MGGEGNENETRLISWGERTWGGRKKPWGTPSGGTSPENIIGREVEKRLTRPYCRSRQEESCRRLPFPMLTAQPLTRKKGDRQMEAKPAQQNIQDSFLNTARKERHNITIYLVSGVKLTGRIRSFDKYSVVLETGNQEQLIFKHAISTVVMARQVHSHGEPKPVVAAPQSESAVPNAASGTEG